MLYIMKGLPASGKSTYARALCAEREGSCMRVNMDEIRESMFPGVGFSKSRERAVSSIRDALIKHGLRSGLDVVSDDTNLNPTTFERVKAIAEAEGVEIEVVDLTTVVAPLECIKRNRNSDRTPVPEHVIHRMWVRHVLGIEGDYYNVTKDGITCEVFKGEDGTYLWDVSFDADPSLDVSSPLGTKYFESAFFYAVLKLQEHNDILVRKSAELEASFYEDMVDNA